MFVITPVLRMGKLRRREVLVRRLTASRWQSWEFTPGHLAPECLLQLSQQRFSNASVYPNPPESLLKHRLLGLTPGIYDTVGLARGPRICISSKFPSDANAAGSGTTLRELLCYMLLPLMIDPLVTSDDPPPPSLALECRPGCYIHGLG